MPFEIHLYIPGIRMDEIPPPIFTWDFIEVFFFFLFTLSGIWVSSSQNTLPLSVGLIHSLAIGVVRKIIGITHQMPLAKGGDWIFTTTLRLVNVYVNI